MGRKSREKRRRREDPAYKALIYAVRADSRGRHVPATPDAYAKIAKLGGSSRVIEALIARFNQRWFNIQKNVQYLGAPVTETLHVVFPLDVFLWKNGVRFTELPGSPYGNWYEHMRWAIDSACQVARMVLCCNPLGASAIGRTQLERWSLNRSTSMGVEQADGVSTAAHYNSIWDHEKPEVPAGVVWTDLSEVLHGRGSLVESARWEAIELATPSLVENNRKFIVTSLTAVQLSLRQILYIIANLAEDAAAAYPPEYSRALRCMPLTLPAQVKIIEARVGLWPLNLKMITRFGEKMSSAGDQYLRNVEAVASGVHSIQPLYSEHAVRAFTSRRLRAATWAKESFDVERQQLGERFNPEALEVREFSYIIIGETAALLARWTTGYQSDALAVASCAIRAAYLLWLEDDDRSMILARTIVEQAARLRTWRLKPQKASLLESQGSKSSTRDWLEGAGWRRLSVLNRSLGELSHVSANSRWSGAIDALREIQVDRQGIDFSAVQTARGDTLNEVVFSFGSELSYLIQEHHSSIAVAFGEVLPYGDESSSAARIEEWLQRCWRNRDHSFGMANFTSENEASE